jgi:hypothetical protein
MLRRCSTVVSILAVLDSNLDREIGIVSEGFRELPQFLLGNTGN